MGGVAQPSGSTTNQYGPSHYAQLLCSTFADIRRPSGFMISVLSFFTRPTSWDETRVGTVAPKITNISVKIFKIFGANRIWMKTKLPGYTFTRGHR
jgi:hypothetical protein